MYVCYQDQECVTRWSLHLDGSIRLSLEAAPGSDQEGTPLAVASQYVHHRALGTPMGSDEVFIVDGQMLDTLAESGVIRRVTGTAIRAGVRGHRCLLSDPALQEVGASINEVEMVSKRLVAAREDLERNDRESKLHVEGGSDQTDAARQSALRHIAALEAELEQLQQGSARVTPAVSSCAPAIEMMG